MTFIRQYIIFSKRINITDEKTDKSIVKSFERISHFSDR